MSAWRALQTVLWWVVVGLAACFALLLLVIGSIAWLWQDDDADDQHSGRGSAGHGRSAADVDVPVGPWGP